ncbi:phage shock protein PspA [Vibrio ulleungensis]|jgi:phage shock protein A|uniref:Phage shock protein PspA n=1 Tax=Vibrio ulleungensis TaxID=2807619 RepID=A0ABS2HJQ6_9VIBR|nr:phage shock protein PspA [Vibrio ulleungensis]MBM7036891.1 phage shock protein PspA [Vibrio ulleungensis]
MGIFSRFADIVNSNISALLDKAEDPSKMIRLIIQEMEDTLVEVRTNLAKAIADKKELARRVGKIESQVEDWQTKASLALSKSREDLARAALIEKQKLQKVVAELHTEQTLVEETIDKLGQEVKKLEAKILETRARQQTLTMRQTVAGNRKQVQEQLHAGRTAEAMAKFDQFEKKIDRLEADADSYAVSESPSLDAQFADLQAEEEIEQELNKLKQSMQDKS